MIFLKHEGNNERYNFFMDKTKLIFTLVKCGDSLFCLFTCTGWSEWRTGCSVPKPALP